MSAEASPKNMDFHRVARMYDSSHIAVATSLSTVMRGIEVEHDITESADGGSATVIFTNEHAFKNFNDLRSQTENILTNNNKDLHLYVALDYLHSTTD